MDFFLLIQDLSIKSILFVWICHNLCSCMLSRWLFIVTPRPSRFGDYNFTVINMQIMPLKMNGKGNPILSVFMIIWCSVLYTINLVSLMFTLLGKLIDWKDKQLILWYVSLKRAHGSTTSDYLLMNDCFDNN